MDLKIQKPLRFFIFLNSFFESWFSFAFILWILASWFLVLFLPASWFLVLFLPTSWLFGIWQNHLS